MCQRWMDSFADFLADMGPKPSSRHSLERKKNSGNYQPDNCIWATQAEQSNNQRSNHVIEWSGETKNLAQWAVKLGFAYSTLSLRFQRGWTTERAMTQPLRA